VPDHGQEKGRERLTKREREMIKELAREIVREAGLARNSEKEATEKRRREFIEGGREYWKAQVDFFKQMTTISAASIAVVTTLSATLLPKASSSTLFGFFVVIVALVNALVLSARYVLWTSSLLEPFLWGDIVSDAEQVAESSRDIRLRDIRLWGKFYVYLFYGIGVFGFVTLFVFQYL
jgi:hypothetical protein